VAVLAALLIVSASAAAWRYAVRHPALDLEALVLSLRSDMTTPEA